MTIPCVVVAYYDFENIKTTVDHLLDYVGILDLHVIENSSELTKTHIEPYFLELVHSGKVSKYFLFDRNISNNALEVVLDGGYIDFSDSEYVMLTDGDLLPLNHGWLLEEMEIVGKSKEVFACGIRLDLGNLPTTTFPDAHRWVGAPRSETDLYLEAPGGLHLVLLTTAELIGFLNYRKRHDLRIADFTLRHYCYEILDKKWVTTKRSSARHLTWDRYSDLGHPYTKLKLSRSFDETWRHDSYSGFELHMRDSVSRHFPFRKMLAGRIRHFRQWPRRATGGMMTLLKKRVPEPLKQVARAAKCRLRQAITRLQFWGTRYHCVVCGSRGCQFSPDSGPGVFGQDGPAERMTLAQLLM